MRPECEFTIAEGAIHLYYVGVDVDSTNQLERELWHEMCSIVYVPRSAFRRAAKEVFWIAELASNSENMRENSTIIADDRSNGIYKTVLFFPLYLLEALLRRPFPEPDLTPVHCGMYLTLGNLAREVGRHDEALTACHEALHRAQKLCHDHSGEVSYQQLYGKVYTGLALALQEVKRFDQAESALRQALEIAEQVAGQHPNDATCHAAVADIRIKLAGLYEATGRLPQADSSLSLARERLHQSRHQHPPLDSEPSGRLAYRCNMDQMQPHQKWLHLALNALYDASQAGQLMAQHQLERPDLRDKLIGGLAALTVLYHRVHAGPEMLDADDPQDPFHHDHLAYFLYTLGQAWEKLDLPEQAKDAYGRAISIFEPLAREYSAVPEYQIGLRRAESGMGRMTWRMQSASYGSKRCPKLVRREAV